MAINLFNSKLNELAKMEPRLLEDYSDLEAPIIHAHGLVTQKKPLKPYVYGRRSFRASSLRDAWNEAHPNDPMPI